MPKAIVITMALLLLMVSAPDASGQGVCSQCHPSTRSGMHAGGVGACNRCHTMHNSQDGMLVDPDSPSGNAYLLVDASPSDVCLQCHAGAISHTMGMDPSNPPPEVGAGNFVFLLEDNLNDRFGGGADPIPGDAAGHNVFAPSQGLMPDGSRTRAPGGNFPSAQLGCTSCHDPHGNTSFRMLNGAGAVQDGFYSFGSPAPTAFGLSIYHGVEGAASHTAYQGGMSAWCGNCHGSYHNTGGAFVHPTGTPLGSKAGIYNLYNGTADPLGGSAATAYLSTVPFEDPGVTHNSTGGPASTSRIMCLSCHRAHASSAPNSGRWDFAVTLLSSDGVVSGSHPLPDPYASPAQRSLCNKCHLKDRFSPVP